MEPMEGEDKKSTYRRLFLEILDVMITNISDRFSDIPKLKFFKLLDQKKFTRFKTEFPGDATSCLAQNYGAHFDFVCLRSKLTAVYSDPEFSRSVCELHEYIMTHDVFPETYNLSKLIQTIPAPSSSTERSFSALKRVKNYLQNTQGQERMSSLSLLNIENRLLDKLMPKENFFDEVIDIFVGKTRRIELQYKS
jgi:hypothetical protein